MPPLIALITDFGYTDPFVGSMKGVIKTIAPACEIIDLSHDVAPFSISNAQYILYAAAPFMPPETLFVVVVDPGVGTARRGLIAIESSRRYILPDNGIISAVRTERMSFYSIDMSLFPEASFTFHGRDVFAPVAARLSIGEDAEAFGRPVSDVAEAPFPWHRMSGDAIECRAVHIDRFGNVITSCPSSALAGLSGNLFEVGFPQRRIHAAAAKTFADIPTHEFGLIEGSAGLVEISAYRASASDSCAVRIDDTITITPIVRTSQNERP